MRLCKQAPRQQLAGGKFVRFAVKIPLGYIVCKKREQFAALALKAGARAFQSLTARKRQVFGRRGQKRRAPVPEL